MKIEKINDNIIKVTISVSDLEERNIDLGSINYDSPATQELFWDMMEQAEIEFGFTASDSQLVFEACPDSDDGFVVTITRVDEDGDFESIQKYIKSKYKHSDLKAKKKNRKICSTVAMYSFSSFDDLTNACSNVAPLYSGDSSLYKCGDTYYLLLTRNNYTIHNMKAFEAIINEYGNKVTNASFYEGYLNEYGTKLIEYNALETVNKYF